jgi:UDP-N-acetylglucosamine 2-epimerase (non-hydrolysing)
VKVVTVLGTRPEIIRLSRVIPLLDAHCDHKLVFTGQNADPRLSDIFFSDLGVRSPDCSLGVTAITMGDQLGQILGRIDTYLDEVKPQRMLILGDTNSGLSALIAKRRGIRTYHMEAGNRCFDDRVPEETNRRVIDHCSDVLLPYTENSRLNLLAEGIPNHRILVTGNPIFEVLEAYAPQIKASTILLQHGLAAGQFLLASMHRAENVDLPERLSQLVSGLQLISHATRLPVLVSTHPRTRSRLPASIEAGTGDVRFVDPFGFFDFVMLERTARCVISDSGTVQEEAAILGVPNVTIRDVTERPETLEAGSNIICGADPERMLAAVDFVMRRNPVWTPPNSYLKRNVAETVARIVLSV